MNTTASLMFSWSCDECCACHVSHDRPGDVVRTGREHVSEFGHTITARKRVNGETLSEKKVTSK